MDLPRESRIALDLGDQPPQAWAVRDDTTDPAVRKPSPQGKDAKLAAALRDNLRRRKAAAREIGPPRPPQEVCEGGSGGGEQA